MTRRLTLAAIPTLLIAAIALLLWLRYSRAVVPAIPAATTNSETATASSASEVAAPVAPATAPSIPAPLISAPLMVGGVNQYLVRAGDSLTIVGARMGVEPRVLAATNAMKWDATLQAGQKITVDNRHLLPKAVENGIVVNVPQRKLFLFQEGRLVADYAVAVGRPEKTIGNEIELDWQTPTGEFKVVNKKKNPIWVVPKSIQKELELEGKPVITRIEAGDDNPLGKYWIGLNSPGLGIHGTNVPASIYTFRTHACMRMHPDDVEALFAKVAVDMPVEILYEPLLLARDGDTVWVEVHPDAYERDVDVMARAKEAGAQFADKVDWALLEQAITKKEGIARDVTMRPEADSESHRQATDDAQAAEKR